MAPDTLPYTYTCIGARVEDVLEDDLQLDDIKVEYHPKCGRDSVISHFQDFKRVRDDLKVTPEEEPFRPFHSRSDFEFARVALQAALKPKQINTLVKIINDVAGGACFTVKGDSDLKTTWGIASDMLTPVS